MTFPFDINELRANIGDDKETERMLLSIFLDSTNESLQLLATQFPAAEDTSYNALWKTHMHQIKGAALNIGAHELLKAAALAQDQYEVPPDNKKPLLENVSTAFGQVEQYIRSLLKAS